MNTCFLYIPGTTDISEAFAKSPPNTVRAKCLESNKLLNLFLNQSMPVVNQVENYHESTKS